jgi:membrane glycosyltransferase
LQRRRRLYNSGSTHALSFSVCLLTSFFVPPAGTDSYGRPKVFAVPSDGIPFAHLLAYSQSLQDSSVSFSSQLLAKMVNSCIAIINLAIETADDRTRHLTDHIYHVVTFSALTLTTAVHLHEPKLRLLDYDVLELDQLVIRLLNWLDTIG